MPRPKKDHALPPGEPGRPEAASPQNNTAEAAASKAEAEAESQVASATTASGSPEVTATSPATHGDSENPDLPGQASDPNPSLGEPGTAESTPSQTDSDRTEATAPSPIAQDVFRDPALPEQTADHNPSSVDHGATEPTTPEDGASAAGASKDEAGRVSQVPAVPPNAPENNLPPAAAGYVKQPDEPDDGECFEPYIPPDPAPPAPKPAPKPGPSPFMQLLYKIDRDNGWVTTPADTPPESGLPAPAATADSGDAAAAELSAAADTPVEAPQPPPRFATAAELVSWITRYFFALTHLSRYAAALTAFWVIPTYFQDALTILPCLVITGPAHDAIRVLHILKRFCRQAALLAGFGRSHLDAVRYYRTNLIWEPSLDERTADLLGSLTDCNFSVVRGSGVGQYSKSTAIFAGENPETHRIMNSIHIHIAPTNAALPAPSQSLRTMLERVPVHLDQYREKNFDHVRGWTWFPSGLSSEMAPVASAFGRCIVDAPELRQKLMALLKTQDTQRLSDLSNTAEAVVVEATLNLCHGGKPQFLVGEIATEANRIAKARGERLIFGAETVGHLLKKVSRPTRRLGKAGKGLVMDLATMKRIHQLAAVYGCAGLEPDENNLHCPLCTENKQVM